MKPYNIKILIIPQSDVKWCTYAYGSPDPLITVLVSFSVLLSLCILWPYDPMVLWSYGPMILWSCDPMILWSYDPMILWSCDPMALWSCGPVILWSYDLVVLWSYGPMILWSCDPMILWSRVETGQHQWHRPLCTESWVAHDNTVLVMMSCCCLDHMILCLTNYDDVMFLYRSHDTKDSNRSPSPKRHSKSNKSEKKSKSKPSEEDEEIRQANALRKSLGIKPLRTD